MEYGSFILMVVFVAALLFYWLKLTPIRFSTTGLDQLVCIANTLMYFKQHPDVIACFLQQCKNDMQRVIANFKNGTTSKDFFLQNCSDMQQVDMNYTPDNTKNAMACIIRWSVLHPMQIKLVFKSWKCEEVPLMVSYFQKSGYEVYNDNNGCLVCIFLCDVPRRL